MNAQSFAILSCRRPNTLPGCTLWMTGLRGRLLYCRRSHFATRALDSKVHFQRDQPNLSPMQQRSPRKMTLEDFEHVRNDPNLWNHHELARKGQEQLLARKAKPTALAESVCQRLVASSADPAALLRELIASNDVDMSVIALCLQAHRINLQSIPHEQRMRIVKEAKLGSIAVAWIWKHDEHWLSALAPDLELQYNFAYFLIAEGSENIIEQLLLTELPIDDKLDQYSFVAWGGGMFRAIVRAHLSLNPDGNADRAIQCFFRVLNKRNALYPDHKPGVPFFANKSKFAIRPAWIELNKQLGADKFPNTSAEWYENLLKFRQRTKMISGASNEYDIARLCLCHPTKADHGPAIALLRRQLDGKSNVEAQAQVPVSAPERQGYKRFLQRTLSRARSAGAKEDAAWVQEKLAVMLPRLDSSQEHRPPYMRPLSKR